MTIAVGGCHALVTLPQQHMAMVPLPVGCAVNKSESTTCALISMRCLRLLTDCDGVEYNNSHGIICVCAWNMYLRKRLQNSILLNCFFICLLKTGVFFVVSIFL